MNKVKNSICKLSFLSCFEKLKGFCGRKRKTLAAAFIFAIALVAKQYEC